MSMAARHAPLLAIVGPTASGKSEVAEELGLFMGNACIVSTDAMQVYRGMDIGTAKTPIAERRLELFMVDVCEPSTNYSAERFQKEGRSCVDTLLSQGKHPILCGGTGLYLNALIDKMDFPHGDKDASSRKAYEARLKLDGADALYAELEKRDLASAKLIHPNNTRRVIRALEMLDEGVHYAEQVQGLHEHEAYYECSIWGLDWDRETLYKRIDTRVDTMFELGLLDEVKNLRERGFSRDLSAAQAIGYKELLDYLEGLCALDEAHSLIKQRSRHYAKRQLSWFRRDNRVHWLSADGRTATELAAEIYAAALSSSSLDSAK